MTEMRHIEDRLHTTAEVAAIFSVTAQTVLLWINKDKDEKLHLDAVKVGKGWRVSKQAMIALMNRMYE